MRITTTTYEVASPDGSVQEFESFEAAAQAQAAAPGSQLRTKTEAKDVDARYGVMLDGELVDSFGSAHDAAVFARQRLGAIVQMVPV